MWVRLMQGPLLDYVYNNTDGDKVFTGFYGTANSEYMSVLPEFVHDRGIIKDLLKYQISESSVIHVIAIDNTIIYQTTGDQPRWQAMNVLGQPFKVTKDIENALFKTTVAKLYNSDQFQYFMAQNRKISREKIEHIKFQVLYQEVEESRAARYKAKAYYKPQVYVVEEDGLFGLVDANNNIVVPIRYPEKELFEVYRERVDQTTDVQEFILQYVEANMEEWNQKDEFESPKNYALRTGKELFTNLAISRYAYAGCQLYGLVHENVEQKFELEDYDAGNETFLVRTPFGSIPISVPKEASRKFKEDWTNKRYHLKNIGFENSEEGLVLTQISFYSITDALLQDLTGKEDIGVYSGNNQLAYHSYQPDEERGKMKLHLQKDLTTRERDVPRNTSPADVDVNIPVTTTPAEQTFAVIIANEQYTREARVPFALRDGEIFARYCQKTLGIPEKNIRLVKNATLNDMTFQIDWLKQILTAHNGQAKAIVYYAGHGIPDEKQQSAYLLPVDGYGSNVNTGYSLKNLYSSLTSSPAKSITVFLDACFSGTKRESGMMTAARGVAIKVKQEVPQGNMVVFTAAQGDETAYQYKEKGHGMFTYFLLKKLQETKGEATLGELSEYVTSEVKKASLLNNNKSQTPSVIPAVGFGNWQTTTLK